MWEEDKEGNGTSTSMANTSKPNSDMNTKSAPITLYEVSSDWLGNLLSKVKCEVMAKAIEHGCPPQFLACLNSIELQLSEDAKFSLNMADSQAAKGEQKSQGQEAKASGKK